MGRGVYGGLRLRFLSEVRGYYPDPDGPRRFYRRLQSWQALNATRNFRELVFSEVRQESFKATHLGNSRVNHQALGELDEGNLP